MKPLKPALTTLLIGVITTSCTTELDLGNAKPYRGEVPDLVLGKFRYVCTDDETGRREWVLFAERAEIYNKKNQTKLESITLVFYDDYGNVKSWLSANLGFIDRNTLRVKAEGNVVAKTKTGTTIKTTRLFWDNNRKVLYNQGEPVEVERDNMIMKGKNLVADANLKEITLEEVESVIEKEQNQNAQEVETQ